MQNSFPRPKFLTKLKKAKEYDIILYYPSIIQNTKSMTYTNAPDANYNIHIPINDTNDF